MLKLDLKLAGLLDMDSPREISPLAHKLSEATRTDPRQLAGRDRHSGERLRRIKQRCTEAKEAVPSPQPDDRAPTVWKRMSQLGQPLVDNEYGL